MSASFSLLSLAWQRLMRATFFTKSGVTLDFRDIFFARQILRLKHFSLSIKICNVEEISGSFCTNYVSYLCQKEFIRERVKIYI